MNESNQPGGGQPGHHRRPRYAGTHPKKFAQKYKERNISAHPDLREKLHAKGKTPAGSHVPVLTEEVIGCLKPLPGQVIADCTLGFGGHASEFINRIAPAGRLIAFDVDSIEMEKTKLRLANAKAKISFYHSNFAGIANVLTKENLDGYDIIFADLGVSSMQIDDPQRGMSYKHDGPLDMRMDSRLKLTGADLLNTLSQEELAKAFWEFSDEPDSEQIAQMLINQRAVQPITEIPQLVRLVFAVKGLTLASWKKQQRSSKFGSLHPAARVFQALRILVNDELGSLRELLRLAPYCLRQGGKIGIISFHSGEDRMVKQAFRDGVKEGVYKTASQNAIVPRRNEVMQNPRSASAKFRWAIKAD
ncbi:MAG: 16S rRNA (cytosine(1402)-N(4))-methyltransferase [Planctomycetes bacterium GWC2_45_44]|nr:MAG: 16S rRNA (cytosine(1402)-N(4))-methyltransferase [Planctomycetes bacterium GWC2_45_44]HBR20837.1 16S rRNA (cytosine(1402)-N(4))-methyltransferase RsmH [Phycisphaerales bacterium]